MKLVTFDLVGQKQCVEIYDSDKDYRETQAKIEKAFGKCGTLVEGPCISLKEIKGRRFVITEGAKA